MSAPLKINLNRRNFLSKSAGMMTATAALTSVSLPTMAKTPLVGAQVSQTYRRKLGSYEITVLADGYIDLPHGVWANVSPEDMDAHLRDAFLPAGYIRNGVNAYLINTGERLILIDSGGRDLFGPNTGLFPGNLADVGVKPEDIDQIMVTHVHPDHVGGLYTADGKVTIPKAQVLVNETDLNYWTSASAQDQAIDFAKSWFDIAREWQSAYDGRIKTFTGETDLGDGITAFPLPGHTPGHTGFLVESEGERLLIIGDAVVSAAVQFSNPDASNIWETNADDSKRSRRTVFDIAARDRTLVTATHIPFPSFGYVDRKADGTYAWIPEEWRYAS